jgi:predicted DNA-binding WGR domain protein
MERNLHATQPDPRFWNIAVRRERITITSGPLHTPGTSRHIDCKSGEVALKTAQALVDQRLKDGFRDAAVSAPAATMDLEAERALLTDAPEGWLVFADELLSWNASSFWKALRNNGSTRWRTRSRRPPSCSATKRSSVSIQVAAAWLAKARANVLFPAARMPMTARHRRCATTVWRSSQKRG